MTAPDFYSRMQDYVVNAGVDMTVLRGKPSPTHTMAAAHCFLKALDLGEFVDPNAFSTVLDAKTAALVKSFPAGGQLWGRARKCLAIFLRNATYNCYLRMRYGLAGLEPLLEVPLDSSVAAGLTSDARAYDMQLPPVWDAIVRLTPEGNAGFQATAAEVARIRKVLRVHLDLWYWRATHR